MEHAAFTYVFSINYHKGLRVRFYGFYFTDGQTKSQNVKDLPKFKQPVSGNDRMKSAQPIF